MPYIEQNNLYNELNPEVNLLEGGAYFEPPTPQLQMVIPVYLCPADAGPDTNPNYDDYGRSSYRGIANGDTPLIPVTGGEGISMSTPLNGTFYTNSNIRFNQITDGLSNTVVIGETALQQNPARWGAIWTGCVKRDAGVIWVSGCWWIIDDQDRRINGPDMWAFGSSHPGGAFFLRGDGSALFVRNSADPSLVALMCSINDGVVANLE